MSGQKKFYGRGAGSEADDNMLWAIPDYPARHMSAIQIWHASKLPKLHFTTLKRQLRLWAELGEGLECVGGKTGARWYRFVDPLGPEEIRPPERSV